MSVDTWMSRLNPWVRFVLRSRAHWLLSPGLLLVGVTGRRSGRRYEIPVGYQRAGAVITVMVSEARSKNWYRNFREPRTLEVRLRGRARTGTAVVVAPGSDEFRERAEATLRRVPGMSRVFRVDFDKRVGLSDEQLLELGAEIAVVRIDLDPAPA